MFKDKILNFLLTCDNYLPPIFTSTYSDKVIQGNLLDLRLANLSKN